MKKAIITVGVSASGKSTWAQEFVYDQLEQGKTFTIIERDKIRADILVERKLAQPGDGVIWAKWKWKWDDNVTTIVDAKIAQALADSTIDGVILSDTNLNADRRAALKRSLLKKGFTEVEEKFFEVSWDVAVKRDTARKNGVGVSVLADQFARMNKAMVKQYECDPMLPKAVIVDIDGTAAHANGQRGMFDWANVGVDDPDECVRLIVNSIPSDIAIIFMSGRDEICRKQTQDWLELHKFRNDALFMRAHKDMRKDDIVKAELFWKELAPKYNVLFCIDDRPCVVRLYHSMGIKVFAVGNQLIEF